MSLVLKNLLIDLKIMAMKNKRKSLIAKIFPFVLFWAGTSCVDKFIPETKEAFDRDVNFTKTFFDPVMGRTTLYNGYFEPAYSTLPLTFEIENIRCADGTPAPELEEFYPVKVWSKPYLGTETSIEEINAKRTIEYRRLFDIRKHSGEMVIWSEANSSILRCQPDSGYVFDVVVSNSGGYKYARNMRLMPKREVDFEPSIYDSETGLAIAEYVNPSEVYMTNEGGWYIAPSEVHIYFRENKDNTDPGSSLKLSFYGPDWKPINPKAFNETHWDELFQAGFLKENGVTDEYVLYDMAYPLPLFKDATKYTDKNGEKAHISLVASYLRPLLGSSYRRTVYMNFDFAIYKEAHWEILFHFAAQKPLLGEIKD